VTDEPFRPEADATQSDLQDSFWSESAGRRGRRGRRDERRRGRRRVVTIGVAIAVGVVVVAVVALVALGGGSDRATKTTRRRRPPTAASSTTSTSSAVTGTTLIPRSSNPIVALAQQYEGRYVGMFSNTTFHTTGPATLDLHIDPSSGTLTATVDLNGDLFGGGAKQVRRINASLTLGSTSSLVTRTSAFGPVTGKLGTGTSIVLTAPSVPDDKVKTFELTGTLRSDTRGFDATFTVGFRDGRSAQGTVTVLCAPQGQRPSQVTTVCGPR
jgi:hypothetical protein